MPDKDDFTEIFRKLRAIFKPYDKKMVVLHDTDSVYMLNTRHMMSNKQPLYFGGVRKGKAYVSFYLMSVYVSPREMKNMSPELKKRMQGKSCFNFKTVDEKLFRELATLTKAGAAQFSDEEFVEALRQLQAAGRKK
ncbi:MAG: hypothetical protein AABM67_13345 [Acidobacteriota bacterium]